MIITQDIGIEKLGIKVKSFNVKISFKCKV